MCLVILGSLSRKKFFLVDSKLHGDVRDVVIKIDGPSLARRMVFRLSAVWCILSLPRISPGICERLHHSPWPPTPYFAISAPVTEWEGDGGNIRSATGLVARVPL